MWGQGAVGASKSSCHAIIPTRVGTRVQVLTNIKLSGDHPHACGDKCAKACMPLLRIESSPRVWGQGATMGNTAFSYRIIPTRVGTSMMEISLLFLARDHPHACGDKSAVGHL